MGQKTNPIGNRLGFIHGWESNWYGGNDYKDKIVEDDKIRKYLFTRLSRASLSKIIIERTLKLVTVTINTARPGVIIGKGGQEVDKLKEELKKLTKKEIQINIFEVKRPELDARLVADGIARQIEARISFRRAIKMAIGSTMRMGAEGIKVKISGRLNGAEMARNEMYKDGRTPLHTFRADIDYSVSEAHTTYGRIGIKVWICKGEVYGKRDLSPNVGMSAATIARNVGDPAEPLGAAKTKFAVFDAYGFCVSPYPEAKLIAGVVPPDETTGLVPVTLVTPPEVPLAAAVIRPCASTVILALVYEPAVTAVFARAIVPELVIVPPDNPVPAVMLVTVPTLVEPPKLIADPLIVILEFVNELLPMFDKVLLAPLIVLLVKA